MAVSYSFRAMGDADAREVAGFVLAGPDLARKRFAPERFTLSVAVFNRRAIEVYRRAGLKRKDTHVHETNGETHEFLRMWREA